MAQDKSKTNGMCPGQSAPGAPEKAMVSGKIGNHSFCFDWMSQSVETPKIRANIINS